MDLRYCQLKELNTRVILSFYITYGCYAFIQNVFFGTLPVEAYTEIYPSLFQQYSKCDSGISHYSILQI